MEIIVHKLSRKSRQTLQKEWMLKIDSDQSFWDPADHDQFTEKMDGLYKELEQFPCSNMSYNTWKFDSEKELDKFMTYFLTKHGQGLKVESYAEEMSRAAVDNYDEWQNHQWPTVGTSTDWDHYDVDYEIDGVKCDGWGPKK
ncbi:MAG: hypothetical protein CMO97_03405 [Woeseia sp.]|nr:hypothetical protein [Woeseia sp.]